MSAQQNTSNFDDGRTSIEAAIDKAGFGLYSYILVSLTGVAIISFACIVYGSTILIPTSACELNTTGGQQGMLAAAPVVGSILGTLVWGYLADTRGRRSMLLVSLLGGAVVNAVASISVNWIMLMLLQLVASIFASGLYSMSMSLLSECVPMVKRNLVVLLVSSIFLLSQGLMAALAIPVIPLSFSYYIPALGIYWNSWRTLVVIYSIPSVFTAVWLFFMQESPKFIFAKGDEERTLQILRVIHRMNNLGSKEEFQVKEIRAEQSEKKDGPSSSKDQIVPLFKRPLLKYTLIMTTLLVFQQVGAFMVWLPTIVNQFIRILETGEGSDLTLCGVLNLDTPVDDSDGTPCALNNTALLLVLAVGAMQSLVNLFLSLKKHERKVNAVEMRSLRKLCGVTLADQIRNEEIRRKAGLNASVIIKIHKVVGFVGRRNIVIAVTALCGLSGILVNLVPNAIGSVVVFAVQLMGIIVMGLYTAIVVALFPTHLRAIALSLPMTGGRIATFASIQILNLMLANNCEAGFYIFASIFASSAIVAAFLPDDRRLTQQRIQNTDKREAHDNETNGDISQL